MCSARTCLRVLTHFSSSGPSASAWAAVISDLNRVASAMAFSASPMVTATIRLRTQGAEQKQGNQSDSFIQFLADFHKVLPKVCVDRLQRRLINQGMLLSQDAAEGLHIQVAAEAQCHECGTRPGRRLMYKKTWDDVREVRGIQPE